MHDQLNTAKALTLSGTKRYTIRKERRPEVALLADLELALWDADVIPNDHEIAVGEWHFPSGKRLYALIVAYRTDDAPTPDEEADRKKYLSEGISFMAYISPAHYIVLECFGFARASFELGTVHREVVTRKAVALLRGYRPQIANY